MKIRPELYKPEYCDKLMEYIQTTGREQTKLPSIEGFARFLGVWRSTLYDWENKHEEFKNTLDELRAYQKEQLMDDGLYGGKEVNATMAIFLLKANHGLKENDDKKDNVTLVFNIYDRNIVLPINEPAIKAAGSIEGTVVPAV